MRDNSCIGVDRMALKLNGKDDRLMRRDFLATARTIGLTSGDADAAIGQLIQRLNERAGGIRLPTFAAQSKAAKVVQDRVTALVVERCAALSGATGEGVFWS